MENWKTVTLGELLTESKIESNNPDTKRRIKVKLNLCGVEKRPDTKETEGATKYYIRKAGQFIYGRQNLHKGALGIVPNELDGFESSSDIPAFDIHESCCPEWIFYYFKQDNFYLKLEPLAKGVGSKRINPDQLFELKISLPSINKQKEILQIVYDFEQSISELEHELSVQLILVDKLKNITLLEAVQGKLTDEWRIQNSNTKSAVEIIKRLNTGKKIPLSKYKTSKYLHLPSFSNKFVPYSLPNDWIWCKLEDIAKYISSGSRDWAKYYSDSGVIFIRMGNLSKKSLNLRLNNIQYVNPPSQGEGTRTKLQTGDYLISITGDVGMIGRIPEGFGEAYINQHIAMVRLFETIGNKYMGYFFLSPIAQAQFSAPKRGIKNSLRLSDIKDIMVPLPPLDEQNEIAKKVELLIYGVEQVKEQIKLNILDSTQLLQSALIEIFGNKNSELNIVKQKNTEISPNLMELKQMNKLITHNINIQLMELVELINEHGKMSAISLWQMSKYHEDIDKFYEQLKDCIENKKTIKESKTKGFLELA